MAAPRVKAGGGFAAIAYSLRKGREAGGMLALYRRLRSRNACKTCALGMGGQRGGMVNEAGRFPEVCKKSLQAQAGDMQVPISEAYLRHTPLSTLARLNSAQMERLGRLAFPLIAEPGDTHFRRISWTEALDRTADALRDARPDRTFFYASGRSSNEAAFLLQLVARAYGTSNIHNCSYYCHQASGAALSRVYGSGTASVVLDDLDKTDLAVICGANPASNHPRLMTLLMHLKRRGGRVLVINPLRELGLVRFRIPSDPWSLLFGTRIADHYLQPKVSSDIALFKALLRGVIERGGVDRGFVDRYTTGWEAVAEDARAHSWQELCSACGVERRQIEKAADMLVSADRGIMLWAMGLTHHRHGVENILALANVALARGWLGRPGSGLSPIRGHSNVQGVGSVGVTPALKAAFARELEKRYAISVPRDSGQDTYASMLAAERGEIDAALLLGGNLYASNPDLDWAAETLQRIPFSLTISTKLNPGHVHGRGRTAIIVPALARDEEEQATTQESMFNFVRMSDGGQPAVAGEMRSEVSIIADIAERVLPGDRFDWSELRSHRKLREAIASVVPGYRAIGEIEEGGEFQIKGRTFHRPAFSTADERAHFHVVDLPDFAPPADEYRLMTLRSEGQFNTVVYEEEDLYRGNTHRNVVMLNGADAARLGVAEGDPVVVETDAGELEVEAAIVDISRGSVAMYYPEANVLVPRCVDPISKTPAFKMVRARLRRAD